MVESEVRDGDRQPQADPPLTLLGKVLVITSICVTFAIAFPITWWITGLLQWSIYPRLMFVVPIVALGFGFWVGTAKLCERLGIAVFRDGKDEMTQETPGIKK